MYFLLLCSLCKTTRFHVAVGLFSNTSRKTSNCGQKKNICGKDISDRLALFSPHFEVICDPLLNRRTASWNLSVKRIFYFPGLW